MPYWEPIRDDQTNYTYSIDNVVVWFRLYYPEDVLCQEILDFISNRLDFDYDHFQSFKFACFRDQFSFRLGDGYSFWLGASFNGAKGTADPFVALDFNPNKVIRFQHFAEIYNFVLARAKQVDFKRFDLAIDIPVDRHYVRLLKSGKRSYTRIEDSALTEYLGKHNSNGFTKVYDKTAESDLDYELTRVEVTCDSLQPALPDIHLEQYQTSIDFDFDLNKTDKVLVELLRRCDNTDRAYWFRQLGRVKQEKIKPYVFSEADMFKYDKAAILHVLEVVENIAADNLEVYSDTIIKQLVETSKQSSETRFTDIPFEKMRLEVPESWCNDDNDT